MSGARSAQRIRPVLLGSRRAGFPPRTALIRPLPTFDFRLSAFDFPLYPSVTGGVVPSALPRARNSTSSTIRR
jgi:hypothetical protein